MRAGGTGTTPGSEPGGPGSRPGLAATTMPVPLSRSLKFESVCCADGGSFCFDRVVAGSSPAVVRDVAQSAEHQCPPPLGSQADLTCSGQLRRTGFLLWREGPHGLAVRIGTARSPSSLTGPIAHEKGQHHDEVLGFEAASAADQPHGADPHGSDAHAHARGRRGVHARRRVGPVPARGDEHGGRGHVLRARRRARRALRRARPRGHGDEPGVRRGPGPVPARHDADALGRDRHGRRVRRRRWRERPRR